MRELFAAVVWLFLIVPTGCRRLESVIAEESHGPAWEHHETDAAEIESVGRWTEDVPVVPVAGEEFFVVERSRYLTQTPCVQCHDGGIEPSTGSEPRRAHWQIERAHGDARELACQTCHSIDGESMLVSIHGRPVSIDQSHELCGDCHFEQLRDWKGGAHGKRVAAWAGERVVQQCTACHDPHDPGFPVRLPTTFNPPPSPRER